MTGLAVKSRRFRCGKGEGELKGGGRGKGNSKGKKGKNASRGEGLHVGVIPEG